jgi:glycine oxidase
MGALNGMQVVIAGAGVVGWTTALELARAGARVTLADPDPAGANASAVAAGMLAPVFEALFDPDASLELLRKARDLWPDLAARIGLPISDNGALAVGPPTDLDAWAGRLAALGASWIRLDVAQARARAPTLRPGLGGLFTAEDWRLEPRAGLAALKAVARDAGVAVADSAVAAFQAGQARLSGGEAIAADRLVVATGASRSLVETAPELGAVSPIKGHILRAAEVSLPGPVVRFAGGYVCPSRAGAVIGATMEAGRADTAVDPAVVRRLQGLAAEVIPMIAGASVTAEAGVRAGTPDNLPMVGPSANAGVWLAVGVRRNGWLLAPLVARMIARSLTGEATDPAFAPGRFEA